MSTVLLQDKSRSVFHACIGIEKMFMVMMENQVRS